jgi:hypothetical protein
MEDDIDGTCSTRDYDRICVKIALSKLMDLNEGQRSENDNKMK